MGVLLLVCNASLPGYLSGELKRVVYNLLVMRLQLAGGISACVQLESWGPFMHACEQSLNLCVQSSVCSLQSLLPSRPEIARVQVPPWHSHLFTGFTGSSFQMSLSGVGWLHGVAMNTPHVFHCLLLYVFLHMCTPTPPRVCRLRA